MTGTVMRTALRRAIAQIKYVHPVRPGAATGTVADVYRQVEDEFGMLAPPTALHSPAPGALAASWVLLRETLLATGQVSRAAKEAVAAAVSLANGCPYCVEVHSTALRGLDAKAAADALGHGRFDSLTDPDLRALTAWARATGDRDNATPVPAPTEHVPELLGVAMTFHYLNRMVNIYLGESPLPPNAPAAARNAAHWMLAKVMRPGATRRPGAALTLLPDAALPGDLGWAAANPTVTDALARVCAAVDGAARDAVPPPVRTVVHDYLAAWDGRPAGLSRAWVDDAVGCLPDGQRAVGRLTLLTAIAAYQVDEQIMADARAHGLDDGGLVAATSWASLAAARRVSTWTPAAVPMMPAVPAP
ncbi:MAG TPA: carboxymuconolactone decarboxylase family protein [Pseudonocardiaceae bacterium]|nr:carboxymuconolactone decarboxylase family protein [Pseudonocardiaceae bacterium]